MKIHWVIILLSLLNSCKLIKDPVTLVVVEVKHPLEVLDTIPIIVVDSVVLDTYNPSDQYEKILYIVEKKIQEGKYDLAIELVNRAISIDPSDPRAQELKAYINELNVIIDHKYVEDLESIILNIEDQTSDTPKNTEGMVAYSVPNEMQVGNPYTIKLRITKIKDNSSKIDLILGERSNNTIYEGDVDTKVIIENIRVESLMSASLIGDEEKFYINEMSTKTQVLEDSSYTEWSWVVNPLKGGNNHLKMIITVVINDDGYSKDIVVFDKSIEVRSNIKFSVNTWFSSYWQWLMTTIIIPITIWIYRKRKKKRESKNFTIEL